MNDASGPHSRGGIDGRLRAALRDAMKARDAVAVAALRGALAALDNAGAVEIETASIPPRSAGAPGDTPGAAGRSVVGGAAGLGASEVPRRELGAAAQISLVEAEVEERRGAAARYEALGRAEDAVRLRAEADVLAGILGSASG